LHNRSNVYPFPRRRYRRSICSEIGSNLSSRKSPAPGIPSSPFKWIRIFRMDFKTPLPPTLLNKPVSVGIVTDDIAWVDPARDDLIQRPGASMRAFRGIKFLYRKWWSRETRKINSVPLFTHRVRESRMRGLMSGDGKRGFMLPRPSFTLLSDPNRLWLTWRHLLSISRISALLNSSQCGNHTP